MSLEIQVKQALPTVQKVNLISTLQKEEITQRYAVFMYNCKCYDNDQNASLWLEIPLRENVPACMLNEMFDHFFVDKDDNIALITIDPSQFDLDDEVDDEDWD